MNILVFSDTHQHPKRMLNIVARQEKIVDCIVHLGDGVTDAALVHQAFPNIPLHVVQGNCDASRGYPAELSEKLGGMQFLLTHGNAYGVKDGITNLVWHAKSIHADAALYGHTHIPNYVYRDGIHIFNPGSLTMPRFGSPTYGLIALEHGAPSFQIHKYED